MEVRLVAQFGAVGICMVRCGIETHEGNVAVFRAEVQTDLKRAAFHVEDELKLGITHGNDQFLLT